MMSIRKVLNFGVLALIVFLALPLMVQAQLTLEGEFRPRTEYRNGYRQLRTANTEPAFFISQRSRLSLKYKADLYEMYISGQDVRVWGEVNQLQDNPNINIHEVWAKVSMSDAMDVKLGRQELVYDDHRLLGSVNWTQQARSHDALVIKYASPKSDFRLDIGGAYNQQSENVLGNTYNLNNYKVLSYIWLNKTVGAVNVSLIGLTDGFENGSDPAVFRYTYGTNMNYSADNLSLKGSLYLQSGDDAKRENINAWMYAAKAEYSFGALDLNAGIDYLSGGGVDDQNPQRKAFNTLYATNHKFYGHMDYFLNVPGDTRSAGLQDIYLGANYKLNKKTGLAATYHHFSLSESIAGPTNQSNILDKALGSEVDVNISHKFSSDVTLKAGYSMLMPTETMDAIKGSNGKSMQHWGWVMLSVTPTFYNK